MGEGTIRKGCRDKLSLSRWRRIYDTHSYSATVPMILLLLLQVELDPIPVEVAAFLGMIKMSYGKY